ncbi:hypothetical protein ACLOJK_008145 [Asimina triloba]
MREILKATVGCGGGLLQGKITGQVPLPWQSTMDRMGEGEAMPHITIHEMAGRAYQRRYTLSLHLSLPLRISFFVELRPSFPFSPSSSAPSPSDLPLLSISISPFSPHLPPVVGVPPTVGIFLANHLSFFIVLWPSLSFSPSSSAPSPSDLLLRLPLLSIFVSPFSPSVAGSPPSLHLSSALLLLCIHVSPFSTVGPDASPFPTIPVSPFYLSLDHYTSAPSLHLTPSHCSLPGSIPPSPSLDLPPFLPILIPPSPSVSRSSPSPVKSPSASIS